MRLEARDASGITTQAPFGIMTVPPALMTASVVVGALALAATVVAVRRGGGVGWTLGLVAALVALAGIGFFGFALWGRFAGMPWTFTTPMTGP